VIAVEIRWLAVPQSLWGMTIGSFRQDMRYGLPAGFNQHEGRTQEWNSQADAVREE